MLLSNFLNLMTSCLCLSASTFPLFYVSKKNLEILGTFTTNTCYESSGTTLLSPFSTTLLTGNWPNKLQFKILWVENIIEVHLIKIKKYSYSQYADLPFVLQMFSSIAPCVYSILTVCLECRQINDRDQGCAM